MTCRIAGGLFAAHAMHDRRAYMPRKNEMQDLLIREFMNLSVNIK